jgi:NADPH:quinone reductase-like Zn-dependent oxidoreductase
MASESADDLQTVRELVEAGVIKTFTDKRYPLDQAAEAHRYVESGGKRGSVVITIKEQS